MEIDKTVSAVAALVGAFTGLVVALKPLIEFSKEMFGSKKESTKDPQSPAAPTGANKRQSINSKNRDKKKEPIKDPQAQVQAAPTEANEKQRFDSPNRDRKEEPDMETEIQTAPPLRRPIKKRLLFGVLILVAGVSIMAFLLLRTQPFQIEITNPRAGESISVAAHKEDGHPTGDGTYIVEGNYSGELGQELKIYVLIRAAKPNESWWIQEDESEIVVRKDRWFINGHWRGNAFFGRGKDSPEGPLKIGELWDIKAVIASRGQKGSIRPDQSMTTQTAESQIVNVKIGNIVP